MSRPRLELSIALAPNENVEAIVDGRIAPEGCRLTPTLVHASEMFWRQLKFADFDVSEMSLSSLLIAISRGDTRWVALPVYTMRKFFHTWIMVRSDAGIAAPADLKGKRVGVPEYQQTSAIWSRGILQHEFGVKPSDIEWHMERTPEKSHGGATGFKPPPGVVLRQIPPSTDIGQMLLRGELDATLLYLTDQNLVDRSRVDIDKAPQIRPLFSDPVAEGTRYYTKTGILPINHTLVVKRSVLERHPWVALNLYSAFLRARNEVRDARNKALQLYYDTGLLRDDARKAIGVDLLAYGAKAHPVIETIARYVHEQGLTDRVVGLSEIFAPSTLEV
jgi:4,5-dihydroxyphthalate decarboxylase